MVLETSSAAKREQNLLFNQQSSLQPTSLSSANILSSNQYIFFN